MAKKEVKAITLAKNEAKKSIKPFIERDAPPSLRDTAIPGERDAG